MCGSSNSSFIPLHTCTPQLLNYKWDLGSRWREINAIDGTWNTYYGLDPPLFQIWVGPTMAHISLLAHILKPDIPRPINLSPSPTITELSPVLINPPVPFFITYIPKLRKKKRQLKKQYVAHAIKLSISKSLFSGLVPCSHYNRLRNRKINMTIPGFPSEYSNIQITYSMLLYKKSFVLSLFI